MIEKLENKLKDIGELCKLILIYLGIPMIFGIFANNKVISNQTLSYLANIIICIVYIIMYFNMFKTEFKEYFKNFFTNIKTTLKYWGIGVLGMYLSNLIIIFGVFNGKMATNETLNRQAIVGNPIIGFICIVLVAPIVEEMIFRYGFKKVIGKNFMFPIISGIVFGSLHVLIHKMATPLELLYIIPYSSLGLAFGYLYNKTDNIFSTIVAHVMHNYLSFMVIILSASSL